MEDKDTSESPGDSQLEEEGTSEPRASSISPFSSQLRAMMRIRHKYQAMKKRRAEMNGLSASVRPVVRSTNPEVFTFDEVATSSTEWHRKRKKKRRSRVLFPNESRKFVPHKDRSRAKPFLVLLSVIVFLQVYNAIENLDDHVLMYDLDGLEKTLKQEVFGQREATEQLLRHLKDYLSTYVHSSPLAVALHGPSGVGKSHIGRILARHFRSVVGEQLVVQYFTLHHCPLEEDSQRCANTLASRVAEVVGQAETEEKIPIFIFDEMEFMHRPLLDTVQRLLQPNQNNEYLNAIYVLISSLGEAEITRYVLQNSSEAAADQQGAGRLGRELGSLLRRTLEVHHPLWKEAEVVPLSLLEKQHVIDCFLDEMTREGFYPDRSHIEQLAAELSYHSSGGRQFSRTGCKQVVAKVNLL
ncbi:torsin-4A-like [Scleropages formosus]|uniref:Torsin-4A-like n=1 Tax=Scleropages formosus TaxID=113540 RepID=A0A0P7Z587_SCLFO|nr:torsin-4A-like [Scleropages formosus]